jgi:putative methionine-R-sulfoxide reductase with GAF domain
MKDQIVPLLVTAVFGLFMSFFFDTGIISSLVLATGASEDIAKKSVDIFVLLTALVFFGFANNLLSRKYEYVGQLTSAMGEKFIHVFGKYESYVANKDKKEAEEIIAEACALIREIFNSVDPVHKDISVSVMKLYENNLRLVNGLQHDGSPMQTEVFEVGEGYCGTAVSTGETIIGTPVKFWFIKDPRYKGNGIEELKNKSYISICIIHEKEKVGVLTISSSNKKMFPNSVACRNAVGNSMLVFRNYLGYNLAQL